MKTYKVNKSQSIGALLIGPLIVETYFKSPYQQDDGVCSVVEGNFPRTLTFQA